MDELENGRGFLVMRGLDRLGLDPQGLRDVYWGLARHMGRTISQNSTGALIGEVFDRGLDYDDNNVRGHTTNAEIGPHCDTADVVGLLCVHPAEEGGESLIASSAAIYNEILATAPHLVDALAAGFRIDLAGKGPTGAADEVTRSRIPVFSWYAGRLSCRFNRKQIEDGQRKLGRSLSDEELEAVETVERLALDPRFRLDMDFRAGRYPVAQQPRHPAWAGRIPGQRRPGAPPAAAPALDEHPERPAAGAGLRRPVEHGPARRRLCKGSEGVTR